MTNVSIRQMEAQGLTLAQAARAAGISTDVARNVEGYGDIGKAGPGVIMCARYLDAQSFRAASRELRSPLPFAFTDQQETYFND